MGYNQSMTQKFTAIVQQDGPFWTGWIVEIPGVNGQGHTREELIEDLRSALGEALEMNRQDALGAARNTYQQEVIELETP